ncbi:MAG: DUF485 domain-containing protein [Planctomycetota bacterium]|nr:DUF485 domain-containing protein [Planctomycetota bacterium]
MADEQTGAPPDGEHGAERNARIGLILFFVYLALYGGFMALSVLKRSVLAEAVAGVNVAILYGVGLIVAALALALVYMVLCREPGDKGPGA